MHRVVIEIPQSKNDDHDDDNDDDAQHDEHSGATITATLRSNCLQVLSSPLT